MPYANNIFSCSRAKIQSTEVKYFDSGSMVVKISAYEYQGKNKKTDEPEGVFWNLVIWGKTGEYFMNQNPSPKEGDYISFSGSIEDASYNGKDGKKIYRQQVRVDNINVLRTSNGGGYSNQPDF